MKLKNLYIALGLSLLLPSCKSDEPVPVPMEDTYMSFMLTLSEGGTRGENDANAPYDRDWGTDREDDEEGTAFDKKIKDITAVIYKVHKSGNVTRIDRTHPVGQIKPNAVEKNGVTTYVGKMQTEYSIDQLKDGDYRMVLFVNANNVSITDPANATFSHHGKAGDDFGEGNFNGIPMYGVADVSFSGLDPEKAKSQDEPYKIEDKNGSEISIPVLRAMAKVRITVDKENEGKSTWLGTTRQLKLKSFKISKHNTKGYVVPKGWDTKSSVKDLKTSTAFNPVLNTDDIQDWLEENCSQTPGNTNTGNSETKLRFYLPETINDQEDPIALTVEYTLDGNDSDVKEHTFYLSQGGGWDKDNPQSILQWDIYRNAIYEFDIQGVEENFKLNLEVSVKDWVYHKIPTTL